MKTCAPSSDTGKAKLQRRSISSFVARGRVSSAQKRDYNELVSLYLLDFDVLFFPPSSHFSPSDLLTPHPPSPPPHSPADLASPAHSATTHSPPANKLVLDLGFGSGESLIHAALHEQDKVFWGVEMYIAGLVKVARGIQQHGLEHVHLVHRDAMELLQSAPDASVADIRLWFPDPWPKRKHHKRRLAQRVFLEQVARVLIPGGWLRMASDHEHYALQMLVFGNHATGMHNCNASDGFVPRCPLRPLTRYEQRGLKLGHRVYDLCYQKSVS